MRSKFTYLLLVFSGLFLASCSKTDESFAPVYATPQNSSTVWVNYSHQVAAGEQDIVYSIRYASAQGEQVVNYHTGSFEMRVPVQQFDSAGKRYAHTELTIQPIPDEGGNVPAIHSTLEISTDYGIIIAQAVQTPESCGYDTERSLSEVRPISWFSYQ